MKKNITKFVLAAFLVLPLGFALYAGAAPLPMWDTTGNYVLNVNYGGTDYAHDVSLTQSASGDLTGNGGSPAGSNVYKWVIDSGFVSGSNISLQAHYTATADAVTPLTTMVMNGVIASNGTISGTWSDNYNGGSRSGTFTTATGTADRLEETLRAEDFGVVNYDTGLGILKGYSAGFGLDNATFENVQSVVVKLYAGDQLLQTNTATAKLGDEITGNQISSPFDVSGNFNYAADGFWTNVRETQYGQSVPATRVVATVTLENGEVLTVENTNVTGDPTTIYPVVTPPTSGDKPTSKDQCKNGGWKDFSNPSYRNQGQCVSSVAKSK